MQIRLWDIFCRVIDNYGDIGVCWRLARNLTQRGQRVRLWIDDPRALDWMASHSQELGTASSDSFHHPCEVHPWPGQGWPSHCTPGDVVIEAFGCELPPDIQAGLARVRPAPPVWINLEYLSAEAYTLRCHRLPSPVSHGPAAGLTKHFWYPGFEPTSGGLLREPGLLERRRIHDRNAFLAQLGIAPKPGERLVSLFCYPSAPVEALGKALAGQPTLVLCCGGSNSEALRGLPNIQQHALPWLDQDDYDRLLWSCDLNVVRGEDSFVRAQWAGQPFLWHIYPQDDGAHAQKLMAFLSLICSARPEAERQAIQPVWLAWNGLAPLDSLDQHHLDSVLKSDLWGQWCSRLAAQTDLADQLIKFAQSKKS
ncbi:putative repeat protein (TIGR03837 family) [Inhella inkyongensis]|uniref:Protein-arginine rhamnosyltransferase n=1 Tax=Inhella inkyongensis TaxID=392593 RepID=A0A840S3L0_9BURK|nr:elongation factor P maturation arginine rhamnosyltransferase EarP [Inhella inkyongensis]MBB5204132.1 putative repeat protein (TIGR03837 family) [Inhella inkyongensis]